MIAHVALAVLVAISIIGIVPPLSEAAIDSNGYVFIPMAPISFKDEFQKFCTIPLRFQLFDSSGSPVDEVYAWIFVNDQPVINHRPSYYYNQFRQNGATFSFNFDTKPYSSSPGVLDLKLSIEVMIGFDNPIYLWESFDITLL